MAFMKQLPAARLVATPKPLGVSKVLSIAATKLVTPRSGGVTPKSTCRCTLLTMADPVRWDDTKSTDSLHIPKLGCVAVSTMPTQLESDMSG